MQLETELKIARRAAELLKEAKPPKERFPAIKEMAAEGLPIQTAFRMLEVSESGFYAWRSRPPSERQLRHAWLTDLVTEIHLASRQTYGSIRVHAELTLGRGIAVGRHQVELVMRRAGLRGVVGRRKRPRIDRPDAIAADLVDRSFARNGPDELWVTDITEHPTREGKVHCAVVLDAFSRRVVGWSIDASPTAALVTGALGMAIDPRKPSGTLIHSDQGTQFTSWAFTHRAKASGLVPSMGSIGDCYDNAMIEAFWSRMQVELLDRQRWRTRVELANAIFEYLEIFHNRQRCHSALEMLTPLEFEARQLTVVA
ncbi:MAG: transposase [Actinomycetota bacterium]|nr:MAG: transposase [Actinomycetota bacterium]